MQNLKFTLSNGMEIPKELTNIEFDLKQIRNGYR